MSVYQHVPDLCGVAQKYYDENNAIIEAEILGVFYFEEIN